MDLKKLSTITLVCLLVVSIFQLLPHSKGKANLDDIDIQIDFQIELYVDAGGPYHTDTLTATLSGHAIVINATIISYKWDFGDGTSVYRLVNGSQTEVSCVETHTYPHEGYFTAVLTVTAGLPGTRIRGIKSDTAIVCVRKPIPPQPSEYPKCNPLEK